MLSNSKWRSFSFSISIMVHTISIFLYVVHLQHWCFSYSPQIYNPQPAPFFSSLLLLPSPPYVLTFGCGCLFSTGIESGGWGRLTVCAPLLSKYDCTQQTASFITRERAREGRRDRGKRDNRLGRCGLSEQEESAGMRDTRVRRGRQEYTTQASAGGERRQADVMFRGVK